MSDIEYIPKRAATQVQYPWRAAIRTGVAVLVSLATVLPIGWRIIVEEVERAGWTVPAPLGLIVAAVIGGVSVAAAIVTRIMAIPQVSDLLTRLGLGPEPAERAEFGNE